MKYNYHKTVLLLIVIAFITSCGSRDKRKEIKELTNSEIENILSICHDDTIMVLGHFIQFDFDNVVSQPVGQYYYVAELLGRPFESTSDIDSIINVVHELYIKTRGTGISMIAIPPTFVPKVEITDKLKQLSLRDLILNDIKMRIVPCLNGINLFISGKISLNMYHASLIWQKYFLFKKKMNLLN